MVAEDVRAADPGRVVEKDLRDLDHLLAVHDPLVARPPTEAAPAYASVRPLFVHDQRGAPMSVAYALVTALEIDQVLIDPQRLHIEALGIPGDPYPVTTVPISLRTGCRALKRLGLIDGYHWTYEVEEIASYVLQRERPLVVATDWYDWMYHPDPETGILKRPHGAAAHLVGGCCFVLFGIDVEHGFALIQPSFGPAWGGWSEDDTRSHGGCARLELSELRRLLRGNGEAVALQVAIRT